MSAYDDVGALLAELAAQGVTRVLASPGSRSTPLAVAAHATGGLAVEMHLDERSAAFWALGIAKASQTPVVLICTSGTAAANYLPAVVEAHYSRTPLIVLTADRPPELRERGAGQTIDQADIFGSHVRWWSDLPVAGDAGTAWFQSTAARAFRLATGAHPGPVHLNVPMREPLEPPVGWRPPSRPRIELPPVDAVGGHHAVSALNDAAAHERGLILAGPMDGGCLDAVAALARRTGWPLLAEPLSQMRRTTEDVVVTAHHDHLLRTPWADTHVPDIVLRVGDPMTSKPLRMWLERHRPRHVVLDPTNEWTDASTTATSMLTADPSILAHVTSGIGRSAWTEAWAAADSLAIGVTDRMLDDEPLMEAAIARELGRALPEGATLVVSNSMPVRDVDSFLRPTQGNLRCLGNRGASGIDGVVSTAAGVASTGAATTLLIGDLAFLHDVGGLLSVVEHSIDLTVVVPNNGGGGIFSFLPIADHDEIAFEKLFRTPQHHSLAGLVTAIGGQHLKVAEVHDLRRQLLQPPTGLRVIEIDVDRDANLDQHRRIAAAIADTIRS